MTKVGHRNITNPLNIANVAEKGILDNDSSIVLSGVALTMPSAYVILGNLTMLDIRY